ncbi:basic leucine zipper 43-like [Arachis stenosperma]|uniref:basic leucine zipper 43-like n=1 Tax=Arachis stenosperma TaxID=217475 RepID=UPI0025AC66B7|nr:basic leucine zipper 43-like [Arachis stenosperma]
MVPSETSNLHNFYLSQENQVLFPPNFTLLQNDISNINLNSLLTQFPSYYLQHSLGYNSNNSELLVPPSYLSSNSTTSDEAEENQLNIIDERRQRRMISNRESARRSRMRKQKHLDELWSQVVRLRNENHNLIDQLNRVSESYEKLLQENACLKEEVSDLRRMFTKLQIATTTTIFSGGRDEFSNNNSINSRELL